MRQAAPVLKARTRAFRTVMAQLCIIAVMAVVGLLCFDSKTALSLILGGLTCCVPSLYFVMRFFKYGSASQAKAIVKSFYLGEMVKLILGGILAVVFVRYFSVSILAFFIGLAGAQLAFWLAPIVE